MTPQETDECILVMRAFRDGKEVEQADKQCWHPAWEPKNNHPWNFDRYVYRIKPAPEPTEVEKLREELNDLKEWKKLAEIQLFNLHNNYHK